jgi:hypothetical protein
VAGVNPDRWSESEKSNVPATVRTHWRKHTGVAGSLTFSSVYRDAREIFLLFFFSLSLFFFFSFEIVFIACMYVYIFLHMPRVLVCEREAWSLIARIDRAVFLLELLYCYVLKISRTDVSGMFRVRNRLLNNNETSSSKVRVPRSADRCNITELQVAARIPLEVPGRIRPRKILMRLINYRCAK